MKVKPTHRLLSLGVILLVSLVICARQFRGEGEAFPIVPLLIAGCTYLLAMRELFRNASFSKSVIVVCLGMCGLWHVAFLAIPTGSDDDVRRYVWDGRAQRLGYNPYTVAPSDPGLNAVHTGETRSMNHPDLPSPYPPGAQLFFRAVTTVQDTTSAMRIALVICDFAIMAILLGILRATGQGAHWILAFAWNPLLATEVAGSGHVDIVGALLLVLSFAALLRRWRTAAAITFACAVAVKFLPLVLLPLFWRRVRIRDVALGTLVFVLLYVPFLDHGRLPIGSLGTYIQSFRFNDPAFTLIERFTAPQIATGLAVLVGILVAAWFRMKSEVFAVDDFAWPMAASLLFAPVVYPWYLLWLVPFARSIGTVPLIVWTVSILPTYVVWHLRAGGHPWVLPGWVMPLEYGAVVVAAATILLPRLLRPKARPVPTN